jgi:hypothetical protein
VCLIGEQAARDQIVKDWANYSAIAKARCVHPNEYLPGYVQRQACLESGSRQRGAPRRWVTLSA